MKIPGELKKGYSQYKNNLLSYYDGLLKKHDLRGATFLLEELKSIEHLQKQEIESSKIRPHQVDFSEMLALTPVDEMPHLSNMFQDILSNKEKQLDSYLNELRLISNDKRSIQEFIDRIATVEIAMHNKLRFEKSKCGL